MPLVPRALAAVVLAVRPLVRDEPDVIGPRLDVSRVPDLVRRSVRPGLAGAAALFLAVGALVVLAAVALSWGEVSTISGEVGAEGVGGVVLVLAQLAYLPNLAVWALSFLAGPGFQVVEGGAITWSGSEGGLLPMVPVLAALPQPGAFPWVTTLSVLAVVAVGAFIGRRALREVARLSRLRTKAAVALSACATSALVVVVLDVVAGGAAGQFRLSSVGAPDLTLFLALLAEPVARGPRGGPARRVDPAAMTGPLRLVVLGPGSGSNLQALIDAGAVADSAYRVVAVGADRDGTPGLERAVRAGIPTFVCRVADHVTRADWDEGLERLVSDAGPDLVVSAGFMKVLGPALLARHRVINTHPALLPVFPGAHGVRDAMAHGVRVTGCTCHWVDAGVDTRSDHRPARRARRGRRHRRVAARADQGRRARDARRRRAIPRRRPFVAGRLRPTAQPAREAQPRGDRLGAGVVDPPADAALGARQELQRARRTEHGDQPAGAGGRPRDPDVPAPGATPRCTAAPRARRPRCGGSDRKWASRSR